MEVPERPRCWLVLTFADDRTYAGNFGYADDVRDVYRYDSNVQNCTRVRVNDIFLIRSRDSLVGVARVKEIQTSAATKARRRCPVCRTAKMIQRSSNRPEFRCARGHEFDNPALENAEVTAYEARLSEFADALGALSVPALRRACPKYAAQASIQLLEPDAIRWGLHAASSAAASLLPPFREAADAPSLLSDEADSKHGFGHTDDETTYGQVDSRELVNRAIRVRRGQTAFRSELAARYGLRCMVTGCELFDIVEAAHIAPYRGAPDNAVVNGLLLRADVHTLFDLNLLAIEPDSLVVHLHPRVARFDYSNLDGRPLLCGPSRPSAGALRLRWSRFQALGSHDAAAEPTILVS